MIIADGLFGASPEPTTSKLSPTEVEAAVWAVHLRFMSCSAEPNESLGLRPLLPLAGVGSASVGPNVAGGRELEGADRIASPAYDSNIIDVLIDGDQTSVLYNSGRPISYTPRVRRRMASPSWWSLRAFLSSVGIPTHPPPPRSRSTNCQTALEFHGFKEH
jgi:hypothetical protein